MLPTKSNGIKCFNTLQLSLERNVAQISLLGNSLQDIKL